MNTIRPGEQAPVARQRNRREQIERRDGETIEQLTTLINNVNNTQRDLELNNPKDQYKQNIREGNLRDGFIHLFGALPYESYGFLTIIPYLLL